MTQAAGQVDSESEVHLIVRGFHIDLSLISNVSRQRFLKRRTTWVRIYLTGTFMREDFRFERLINTA